MEVLKYDSSGSSSSQSKVEVLDQHNADMHWVAMDYFRERFEQTDDVFCISFLKTILLFIRLACLSDDLIDLFKLCGCSTVFILPPDLEICSGPYLYSASGIYWAWRLFPDEQEAFFLSTIPSQQDCNTYEMLKASAPGPSSLSVAVPSRLYFTETFAHPLEGLRVSVKDVFHLKGTYTGAGNRAYRCLYPPFTFTSVAVQRAVELGAIIVGKAKTAEFAGSQEFNWDWCDYSYAFNARADGYLVSTGSSTGSASGHAAYPWLDMSIGSDAGGSIRDPSVVYDIFGFRPTHDGSPTNDAVIPYPIFQVPGFMGRCLVEMLNFGRSWLRLEKLSYVNLPIPTKSHPLKSPSIYRLWRTWFPPEYYAKANDVQAMAEKAVAKLAKYIRAKLDRTSLEELWKKTKPAGAPAPFSSYFRKTSYVAFPGRPD